jgi:hypothetical protein
MIIYKMRLVNKIADIIYTHVSSMCEVNGIEDATDAIIAALPSLISPLVWEHSTYHKHEGCVEYAETSAGTYFIKDDLDDFTGLYCDFVYLDNCTWFGTGKANSENITTRNQDDSLVEIKELCDTHWRDHIMAAFIS